MKLGKYLSGLIKPELEELKLKLNLTEDEMIVFDKLSKGHTLANIEIECNMSESTIIRRMDNIDRKISRITEGKEMKREIPIADKYNLTLDEAAAYFNIGTDKLREISEQNRTLAIMVGTKRLIKKKAMEKYLDAITTV